MRLDSMWGITLPVMLFSLSSDDISKLRNRINTEVNKELVKDFDYTVNALNQLNRFFKYEFKETFELSKELKLKTSESLTLEEKADVLRDLQSYLVLFLIEKEIQGVYYSIEPSEIYGLITNVFNNNKTQPVRLLRKTLRDSLIRSNTFNNFTEKAVKEFDLVRGIYAEGVTTSSLDKKILLFYYKKINELDIKTSDSTKINAATSKYLIGNPKSILYEVANRLDTVINTSVKADVQRVKDSLQKWKDEIETLVDTGTKPFEEFDSGKHALSDTEAEVFTCLKSRELSEDDIEIIQLISNAIDNFNVLYLNREFGENLTEDEWNTEFDHLTDLGIYGLNFDSLRHFKTFLEIAIITSNYIRISSTSADEIKIYLELVQDYLDSLLSLGEEIEAA